MAKNEDQKVETKEPEPVKDQRTVIYDDYLHGKNCASIAEELGLDSGAVLAIIQSVEQERSKKG